MLLFSVDMLKWMLLFELFGVYANCLLFPVARIYVCDSEKKKEKEYMSVVCVWTNMAIYVGVTVTNNSEWPRHVLSSV